MCHSLTGGIAARPARNASVSRSIHPSFWRSRAISSASVCGLAVSCFSKPADASKRLRLACGEFVRVSRVGRGPAGDRCENILSQAGSTWSPRKCMLPLMVRERLRFAVLPRRLLTSRVWAVLAAHIEQSPGCTCSPRQICLREWRKQVRALPEPAASARPGSTLEPRENLWRLRSAPWKTIRNARHGPRVPKVRLGPRPRDSRAPTGSGSSSLPRPC